MTWGYMGTKASTARTCKQELVDNLSTHWIWKLCCSIFGLASFYRDYEILKKAPAPSEDHEALQIVFSKVSGPCQDFKLWSSWKSRLKSLWRHQTYQTNLTAWRLAESKKNLSDAKPWIPSLQIAFRGFEGDFPESCEINGAGQRSGANYLQDVVIVNQN